MADSDITVGSSGLQVRYADLSGGAGTEYAPSVAALTPGKTATLFPSAAQTATQIGADTVNVSGRGIHVILDMTVVGTGSVTLEIDGKDPASGKYYSLLTGAAVTTNVTNVYRVYPGLVAAANAVANDVLPPVFRIKVTANNANSATYSVGYSIIP